MQAFTEQLARDRQHAQELVPNREETVKLSKLLHESQIAAKKREDELERQLAATKALAERAVAIAKTAYMAELARYQEHRQQHAKELARYKQQALMRDQDRLTLIQCPFSANNMHHYYFKCVHRTAATTSTATAMRTVPRLSKPS
eukprot:15378-Heterococcus_DN1.PRE.1